MRDHEGTREEARRQVEWSGAADSGADGSGVWGDSPDDGRGMSTRSNRELRVEVDRERRLLHLTVRTPVARGINKLVYA